MTGVQVTSYAVRGSASDVEVNRIADGFMCESCRLGGGRGGVLSTRIGMIDHLEQHQAAGHRVEDTLLERLWEGVFGGDNS